jgi:hypothetical protein
MALLQSLPLSFVSVSPAAMARPLPAREQYRIMPSQPKPLSRKPLPRPPPAGRAGRTSLFSSLSGCGIVQQRCVFVAGRGPGGPGGPGGGNGGARSPVGRRPLPGGQPPIAKPVRKVTSPNLAKPQQQMSVLEQEEVCSRSKSSPINSQIVMLGRAGSDVGASGGGAAGRARSTREDETRTKAADDDCRGTATGRQRRHRRRSRR